jgi:hypothetical protein
LDKETSSPPTTAFATSTVKPPLPTPDWAVPKYTTPSTTTSPAIGPPGPTGPTGAIGWPSIVNPATDPTYLTTANIGTINVITSSNVGVNTSGLTGGNAGAFWTFSNATLSNRGIGYITGGGSINVGGTTVSTYSTIGGNVFTLVYDGTNLLLL